MSRSKPALHDERRYRAGLDAVRRGILTGGFYADRDTEKTAAGRWGWKDFDQRVRKFYKSCQTDGDAVTLGEAESQTAAQVARQILAELKSRTLAGNPLASECLADLAHEAAMQVNDAIIEGGATVLEMIRVTTRSCLSFPVLVSPHPQMKSAKRIEQKISQLEIAREARTNKTGFDVFDVAGQLLPVHVWNERLFMCAKNWLTIKKTCGLELVDLSQRTPVGYPLWMIRAERMYHFPTPGPQAVAGKAFNLAWSALMWATRTKPEQIEELRKLGEYKEGTDSGLRKTMRGVARNELQAGIRERLRKAWMQRYAIGGSKADGRGRR